MARSKDMVPYEQLLRRFSEGGVAPDWVESTVAKDVPRTLLAGRPPPGSADQEALSRLLCALAQWDPELAYCQGMNYVARFALLSSDLRRPCAQGLAGILSDGAGEGSCGSLAEHGPQGDREAESFWLVASLMWNYGARGLFLHRTPLLKLYSFCLSRLLEQRLPEVHSSLEGLDTVLGYKWFGTLFTTVLPFEVAAQAWDLIFRDGLPALLRLALGLCSLLAPTLSAARREGEEAAEVVGRLQRQLPKDVTPLLPQGAAACAGGQPAQASWERKAGARLLEAAEGHSCSPPELEPLLAAFRRERPADAADLSESFTFQVSKL